MVCSFLRREVTPRRPQGVRVLLAELSSQMVMVEDIQAAFGQACRITNVIGDSPVFLANRVTVSAVLNESCRAAGVPEPHVDAASVELMTGGVFDVADDDGGDRLQDSR